MSSPGAIACIGGGGFLVDDVRGVQERHLSTLIRDRRGERPRVLFLGLAHGDAESRQLKAYKMFSKLGCGIANVRLPGEEACEVPAVDLSSR